MLARLLLLASMPLLAATAAASANELDLAGTEWRFAGDPDDGARSLSFAGERRVFGFGGCNRFSGSFDQQNDKLTFAEMVSTQMACPPDVMKREEEFLSLLAKVRGVKAQHAMMLLLDASGQQITTMIRRDTD